MQQRQEKRAGAATPGDVVRVVRQAKGFSLRQAAAATGVAASTLSRWEAGAVRPRVPELEQVLTALDVSPAEHEQAFRLLKAPRALRRLEERDAQVEVEPALAWLSSGDLLKALRARAGYTRDAAAVELGVSVPTVNRWENGRAWPNADAQARLCALFEASPAEARVLQAGPGVLAADPLRARSLDDLATLARDLAERGIRDDPELSDLAFLETEAALLPQARQRPGALSVLAFCRTWHGAWLSHHGRFKEAGVQAAWALDHMADCAVAPPVWCQAVRLQAQAAARHSGPLVGLRALRAYLPLAEARPAGLTTLYREMAELTGETGHCLAALALIERAEAEAHGEAETVALARWIKAGILPGLGRAAEALTLLPDPAPLSPLQQALVALRRAEALLALGAWSEAEASLMEARQLAAAFGFPQLAQNAEGRLRALD